MTDPTTPAIGCVVLSQGNRPAELDRTLRAVLDQDDVELDLLVVGNGWAPSGLPEGVRSLPLADNVGVPGGRNIGAAAVSGEVLFFLDDDVLLLGNDLLRCVAQTFADQPDLGVLQPRSIDGEGGPTAKRHVPRVGGRDPDRSGDVAWFWEGSSFVRRTAFDAAGQWPAAFFYGHEGIELAWRVVDAGFRIHYAADLQVVNPPAEPFRGEQHRYFDGRNRVWVARRNLPLPLLVVYVLMWFVASLARASGARRQVVRGFLAGCRESSGPRRPIGWRACARLTLLGRPPIL